MPCGLWRPTPGPRHRRGYEAHGACGDGSVPCCPRACRRGRSRLGRSPAERSGRPSRTAPRTRSRPVRRLKLVSSAGDAVVEPVHGHFRDRFEAEPAADSVRTGVAELGVRQSRRRGVHVQAAHAPSLPRRQTSSAHVLRSRARVGHTPPSTIGSRAFSCHNRSFSSRPPLFRARGS